MIGTENPAAERSGSMGAELRRNPLQEPTETENTNRKRRRRRSTTRTIAWFAGLVAGVHREVGWWKCSIGATVRPVAWISRHCQFFSWITNGVASKSGTGSGKHSFYTHVPKDPSCDICLRQKTCWYSRAQSGNFWWFDNYGSQKFSVKEVNHVIIIDTLLWYKIWQLSSYNLTRAKQKLLRRPQRA